MTRMDFIMKYEITDAVPIEPSRRAIPAEAFSSALCDFLDNRFAGAIRTRSELISAQPILVSAEYAAYFFKTLLTDIYGRVFLQANIESNEKELCIIISADEALPLADSERRNLIRLARNAGFEIWPDEKSLKLTVGFSSVMVRRVYAVSIMDGKRFMLSKLIEIFYSGKPITSEAPPATHTARAPAKKKNTSKTTKK